MSQISIIYKQILIKSNMEITKKNYIIIASISLSLFTGTWPFI